MTTIVTYGNKYSQYALIFVKRRLFTCESVDDKITYFYSDNINALREKALLLKEQEPSDQHYDLDIFDYKNVCYRKIFTK